MHFADSPATLDPSARWQQPRVVYLQNVTDPIIWWTPGLAFPLTRLVERSARAGRSPAMQWYPLGTFWQVTADMADSTSVPPGAGHVYSALEGAPAWASIIPPSGWTPQRTAALAEQPDN